MVILLVQDWQVVDSEALPQKVEDIDPSLHRQFSMSLLCLMAPNLMVFIRCEFLRLEHRHHKSVPVRLLNCTSHNKTIKCNGRF